MANTQTPAIGEPHAPSNPQNPVVNVNDDMVSEQIPAPATIRPRLPPPPQGYEYMQLSPNNYSTLSNDEDFFEWNAEFIALTRASGFDMTIDQNFVPPVVGTTDYDNYEFQQIQIFPILLTKVKTIDGKMIVDKYIATSDAYSTYKDLVTHYTARADRMAHNILKWLMSVTIEERETNTETWILHWLKQLRKCERLLTIAYPDDPKRRPPDQLRLCILQRAVRFIEEFYTIQENDRIIRESNPNGTAITLDKYRLILLEAAKNYDRFNRMNNNSSFAPHHSNRTFHQDDDDDDNDQNLGG